MSLLHQRAVWSGMAAMMACGLLTAGAAPGASATAMTGMARPAASAAAGQLSTARQVPGLNALNAGGNARVNSVSCGSPGNCAAVGAYTDASGNLLPFVADEKNGTWGSAQTLDFATITTKPKAEALSVSCASTGNCSAVGYINPAGVVAAFTADEKGGTWGRAVLIPGISGQESE